MSASAIDIWQLAAQPDVEGKFGKMRKAQRYTVYPIQNGRITVQSDKSIGMFDAATGKGVLNLKGTSFNDLYPAFGAQPFEFPAEFVKRCKAIAEGRG